MTIYLDDILIYSNNPVDHKKHVCEVLCCLCENGLYTHLDKCHFPEDTVKYLGFIFSKERLKMDLTKVQTIKIGPSPARSKIFKYFLALLIFIAASFLTILTL